MESKKQIKGLDNYEVGKLLGKGTYGEVFQGRDLRSGEQVAIK